MRLRRIKIIGLAVGGILVLGLWIFFAPTKLGGSTTYAITAGNSMQPLLSQNDLALIRAQPSYHVGDVVLYQSQVLHRPVLHRITVIQNGNYFFKGDNNDFVDPGYATQSELVGKLWIHIPGLGGVLRWLSSPLPAALLAGLAAVIVILAGFMTTRHRRGRRHGGPAATSPPRHTIATMTPPQATVRRLLVYFDGPMPTLVALGMLVLLTVLLLGIGLSRPLHRDAPLAGAYKQAGNFSYSAAVTAPTPVYPSGIVTTGEPIYPSLVNSVMIHFNYRFTSSLPHQVKGTIELRALLLSQADTWQQLTTVQPPTPFTGDSASLASNLPLSGLYSLIDSVSAQSGGTKATNYLADVQPVVHITGVVGGKSIDEIFEPALPFTVAQSVITLNDAVTPAPPGATYITPSPATARAATLNPVQSGSVLHPITNYVSIARYHIEVPLLRLLGLIAGALAIGVAVLHEFLRRRQPQRSEEELIARQFQVMIVPVTSLPLPAGDAVIEVPEFMRLAGLAQFLELPIMCELSNGNRIYAVDDEDHRYITRHPQHHAASQAPPTAITSVKSQVQQQASAAPTSPHQTWHPKALIGIAGVLVVAVVISLVTSFTASTTVPSSRVDVVRKNRQISQLTPASCSSLAPTSIVFGSGTFSNNLSHVIIIGSPNVDTITDTGSSNCIIGGGGKDVITGTSTDICILGPTTGASYSVCTIRL